MPNEGQQFYENKLQEFRKRSVNSDNYKKFISDVNNIISEANSSIEEMRQEIKIKQNQIEEIKNTVGEDTLERLRKKDAQGYHYDLREIRELKDDLVKLRTRMFERSMVRGDLHDVKNKKIQPVLESLDAESIRSDVYEQMNELTERRIETSEERLESRIETVLGKVESDYKDLSRQLREVREASRRESNQRGETLIEFMEEVIRREKERGNDVSSLEEKRSQVASGEEVDSVDIDHPSEYEYSEEGEDDEEEGSELSGESESITDVDKSLGQPGRPKSEKSKKIIEELRKMEDGDSESEYSSQSELAEEFDVTAGRVSQLKKKMKAES